MSLPQQQSAQGGEISLPAGLSADRQVGKFCNFFFAEKKS